MFDDDKARDAADRLGQIWDDVTRAGGNPTADRDDAAFAGRLQRLAPSLDDTTRGRMRARVLASQRGEARSMSRSLSFKPSAPRAPRPMTGTKSTRSMAPRLDRPFMRIAAMILLALAIGGTWLGLRSFNSGDETPTPVQGAVVATPENGQDEIGYRESVLVQEVPVAGVSRAFTVDITRVTLPPGSSYGVRPGSLDLSPNPIGFYVLAGNLRVTANGTVTDIGPGGSWQNGIPTEIRSATNGNVTFIQLTLLGENENRLVLPENATAVALGQVPVSQPLGSITTVNFSRMASNMPDMDIIGSGTKDIVAFVAVNSGKLTLAPASGSEIAQGTFGNLAEFAASDGAPLTLTAGDTLTANSSSSLASRGTMIGDELMTGFVLTLLHASPAEVAAETMANGSSIDWTVPANATTAGMAMSSITLPPGAEWSYQFDGATLVQVVSGTISVGFDASSLTSVSTGQYAQETGSGIYLIRNTGNAVATVLRATMSAFTAVPEMDASLPGGVEVETIANERLPITPGTVTIHFGPQIAYLDSMLSTEFELGGSLFVVTGGGVAFTPKSDDVEIILSPDHANPAETSSPAAGISNPTLTLGTGDVARIPNGGAYSLTAAGNADATLLWFWFEPAESDATPAAGS